MCNLQEAQFSLVVFQMGVPFMYTMYVHTNFKEHDQIKPLAVPGCGVCHFI